MQGFFVIAPSTLAPCVLALILSVGCDKKTPSLSPLQEAERVDRQVDELYARYLTGDAAQAEDALHRAYEIYETSGIAPSRKAHGKNLCCARLYVLCDALGRENEAEGYLVEARYWELREKELDGALKAAAGYYVKRWDADHIKTFVDEWDRRHNAGQLPRYRQPDAKPVTRPGN